MQIFFNLLDVLQQLLTSFMSAFIAVIGTACGAGLIAVVKRSKNHKH
ncbi:hypothetical protein WOSG25_140050 [Weissella oryzae SG25]|uniref:Uncharacterized protein n=1 Tax=Weissella oryzae (strain DSM 25784 / JCM 18191 / LMG 30913 / SG25) TaxID=1329250 RepID=A0A069CWW5_WEIOS|nr:hypothetical protein [Weissella oryzae]GAK31703.1 hypothetical protein WOSG25_140050 [Weissella oryzae SG25]